MHQTKFIMETDTINPDQTAPKEVKRLQTRIFSGLQTESSILSWVHSDQNTGHQST